MKWSAWMMALSASAIPAMTALADNGAPPPPSAQAPEGGSPAPGGEAAPKDKAIEVVVTGTRMAEDSRRTPVRTEVVTRAEAERRGATNVGEALAGQLGVQVNPGAYGFLGQAHPSGIQIQGFDADRVLILEDGERMIGDRDGVVDLGTIPLTDVSRIELVTGPSSSLYGTNAIGGVVNVITAPPEIEGPSGRVSAQGRYPWGFTLQGSGAYRWQDTWAALDASFQKKEGIALSKNLSGLYEDLRKDDLTLPNLTRGLIGLRAGTRIGSHISLTLRARWVRDDLLGLETEKFPTGTKVYDLPERTDRFALHLGESIDLPGGASLRFTAGRQWFTNTSVRDQRNAPSDVTRDRADGMQSGEVVATIPEGSSRTYVVGARFESERYEQQATTIAPAGVEGITTTTTTDVAPTVLGSAALYGQARWAFGDMLTILPGVRGEAHLRYGAVVAPRLAVSFTPSKAVIFRVSGGQGFRAPSAKELGFSFDHSYLGYCVLGNSELKPEKSWGLNGDITLTPTRGLSLRGGAFINWVNDLIDFDFLDGNERKMLNSAVVKADCQNVMQLVRYQNITRARTFGFQVDSAYRINPWLRAEAGYSYLWTRDDTNEQPLQGRPPHTVTSAITATLPLKLELYLRYRAVTDAFIREDTRTLGFQTLDARLARELWPKAKAYVGVQNIFGAQKDPTRCGGDPTMPDPRLDPTCVDQRPLEGRVIYIGLTAEAPWRN